MSSDALISLFVAFASGGALLKLIEVFAKRSKNVEDVKSDERHNLRDDITFLRVQIEELRGRIEHLEAELLIKTREVTRWQRLYWQLRLRAERIIDYLQATPQLLVMNADLKALVKAYQDTVHEVDAD